MSANVTASSPSFPIVGIGASAGGLSAFEAFFSGMSTLDDTGMAFVLVQHLAPDHKSLLAELMGRYTRMQVLEVTDGMRARPNCVYIIPPNHDMALLDGTLSLLAQPDHGLRLPIDFFFRSLAQDQRERAICIVLSGTGRDGTLGVRAIKGEGGMVMAQTPESSEHDGMPRSAIETGMVDSVLSPAEMPAQLVAFVRQAFGRMSARPAVPSVSTEEALNRIFVLLRAQTRHDFSQYKRNTIVRRIERRMAIQHVEQLDSYVRHMQQTPAEVDALFRDLLIGVTSFFRDPAAFAVLEKEGIPRLFAGKPPGASIRVWVPGVSTGEEAYSIAMLLHERCEALAQSFKIQVFATDIDASAIERARRAVYPMSIAADVSPERLARFFSEEPDASAYRIRKEIRDLLIFSEQDVLREPPFSKLDLISCRNLLIYLEVELQRKLINLFHYALSPGGTLFLGTSETVGDSTDLFGSLDRASRLYERMDDLDRAVRPSPRETAGSTADPEAARSPLRFRGDRKSRLRELTEAAMLQELAVVAALVDEHGNIRYLHGRTGDYLELAPGETGSGINMLTMAREGLRRELTAALRDVASSRRPIRRPGLRIKHNGGYVTAHLTVRPVTSPSRHGEVAPNLLLVMLERASAVAPDDLAVAELGGDEGVPTTDAESDEPRITALKRLLRTKEEYLRAANEELETSNEELKSSNEEMQSMNEELQSTNEELETSKEELQSVNEELSTLNAVLQQKVTDLSRVSNDMNNLLAGTGIGTIFVDHALRIQRFTPAAAQVVNLIVTDVGRPLGHIVSNLVGYASLVEDTQAVLDSLVPNELTVQSKAGAWYSMRIRPYRTLENVIEGAVISFFDITELKRAQDAARESERILREAGIPLTEPTRDGGLVSGGATAKLGGHEDAEARRRPSD